MIRNGRQRGVNLVKGWEERKSRWLPRRLGWRRVRSIWSVEGVRARYHSLSRTRIVSLGVLCCKTLVGEQWIENDLYVYWELGAPAV